MCCYIILAFLWAYILGYRGWELVLLTGVLLIQALNALVSFIRSNVAALQWFKTDGLLSITDRLLMICICGFLLLFPATARNFKIQWFVIAQIVSYFTAAVLGYLILRRIGKVRLRFSFDAVGILAIMRQSLPYAILIFLMSVYNRADAIIIERTLPDGREQAGIWAAAFRLLDMANILGLMFATILLPLFGRMIGQKENVQPIVKLCMNMLLPLSVMVAVAGLFFGGDIMYALYKNNGLYTANAESFQLVFSCLMLSFPAWCIMYIYSTLLTANGSMKTLNIIAVAGVIINLSLNFYLVPRYKAFGGAVTSLLTQTTLALTFMVAASRIFRLPFNIRWILSQLGYIVIVVLCGFGAVSLLRQFGWVIQLLSFGALCTGLMFVFRFISPGNIRQLFAGNQ
jgi:O-antigen/teichoic acid export membrane protein